MTSEPDAECARNAVRRFDLRLALSGRPVVALAGNPNTGKSTVFNALTGMRQHTGNWPGKTVVRMEGLCSRGGREMVVVDLPGTYSLLATSADEIVARDFICFGRPDATVIVLDATCLERNLNLALQVVEITPKAVVCLNLMDEARHKGIDIDRGVLERELGIPVVPTVARDGKGLDELVQTIWAVANGEIVPRPRVPIYAPEIEQRVEHLQDQLAPLVDGTINRRWVALRLIEGDDSLIRSIAAFIPDGGGGAGSCPKTSPKAVVS